MHAQKLDLLVKAFAILVVLVPFCCYGFRTAFAICCCVVLLLLIALNRQYSFLKWLDFTYNYTIAEASSIYNEKYGSLVSLYICGADAYVTSDEYVIKHVMRINPKNYVLRPGSHSGLKAISMLNNGIIWNQSIQKWRHGRKLFARSLKDLKSIAVETHRVAREWCDAQADHGEMDMMNACGSMTFSLTISFFFGIRQLSQRVTDRQVRVTIKLTYARQTVATFCWHPKFVCFST